MDFNIFNLFLSFSHLFLYLFFKRNYRIRIQNMNKFSSFFFRRNNYLNIKNIDIDKDKDINKDINS